MSKSFNEMYEDLPSTVHNLLNSLKIYIVDSLESFKVLKVTEFFYVL